LLGGLVLKPLPSSNVTPATVFRVMDKFHPTLLIDEGDTFLREDPGLRGILDSGHLRSSAYVLRCIGDSNEVASFCTWGPKAIAAIGTLHPR
jgi:putative DNA primase/helicase